MTVAKLDSKSKEELKDSVLSNAISEGRKDDFIDEETFLEELVNED